MTAEQLVDALGTKLAESDYRVDPFCSLMALEIDGGKVDESDFYQRLISDDKDFRMPAESDPLPSEEVDHIRSWSQQGAKFDGQSAAPDVLFVFGKKTSEKA